MFGDPSGAGRCETCLMPVDDHVGDGFTGCLRALGIAISEIRETLSSVGHALLLVGGSVPDSLDGTFGDTG